MAVAVFTTLPGAIMLDLTSLESIVAALYRTISGPAGAPRDWDTERVLLHPGARLMPTRPTVEGGGTIEVFDLDGYIRSRTPIFDAGDVYEVEIGRQEWRFGNIAHVLSAYELRRRPEGPVWMRGVNSIQCFWDGTRWWVLSILWDNEREGLTLPPDLTAPVAG
jgi:hypothetical protein